MIAGSMNRASHPPGPRSVSTLALAATAFFIVSGGPYGTEEIVAGFGYRGALMLLVVVPLVWSLPVAAMVGELGAALPEAGGYYAWVRRGLGPFWGVQEAWLSIAYGMFDMAIYPTLFVSYLAARWPALGDLRLFHSGWWVGVAMIAACAAWNLRGTGSVGRGSTWLGALLLAPFVVIVLLALVRLARGELPRADVLELPTGERASTAAGALLCMWNYMGWDNASTIAHEVDDPAKSYPRAIFGALAITMTAYVSAVLAASMSGLRPGDWETGSWVEVGFRLGGPLLRLAVLIGATVSAFGMFNALLLTASQLPVAMAEDGWLPRALAMRSPRTGAPVRAVLVLSVIYAAGLTLGIKRLVEIDVALYGAALVLEFVALARLRTTEPALARPFRVPGGRLGAWLIGVPPTALLVAALFHGRAEPGAFGLSALTLAVVVAAVGPLLYVLRRSRAESGLGATE
jgi:amino acid transporter